MQHGSLNVIILSTIGIAVVHALAPDHWVPFVSVARARSWSTVRLLWVTFVAGLAHIGSSIVIGGVGMLLGFSLAGLKGVESNRGTVAGLLLIGFGIALALWGLKNLRSHRHVEIDPRKALVVWSLVVIFLLGPCEPLIPLMFAAAAFSPSAVVTVTALFGAITVAMMMGQALLAYKGVEVFGRFLKPDFHLSHVLAGLIIAATGASVMLLGI
jgi:hypothetical protein